MGAYKFVIDKKTGDIAEEAVLKILHGKGFTKAYRVIGKEVKWDIVIPETGKTIEVKNDKMSAQTGNVAIEMYKNNGLQKSGIMASESDLWVIFAGADEMYIIDTNLLREYCIENKDNCKQVWGGDKNTTRMMLINIDTLKKQSFFKKLV